ncbi:hypothetical protein GTZ99_10585 [Novosphingobium sp. FSY-8]|uniref:Uncharacterized protein n=1 Tax=Novosphingobium ovatum TaxID=1908523 RepID=A0ABW9XEN3_9SPHN|nr:hypothetical protein [Novosphingobium ovatum]NBC37002.1 hypothetical protein [Novosphingobium ovatum]
MTAGVSPVSPVTKGTPASRTQYEATPVTPAVTKATAEPKAEPPSRYDPNVATPRPANNGLDGFNIYA